MPGTPTDVPERHTVSPERPGGFRLGPIPHYSTTTRNGTNVSCGGCCLPIPVGCLTTVVAVATPWVVGVLRRRRSARNGS